MSGKITDNLGRASGLIKAAGGGGKVGQVLTVQNSLVESTTSTSFATIADLSIAITPSATTSKIMTFSSLTCGMEANHTNFRLMRDSTAIGIGDANGSRSRSSFSIYETTSGQYSAWVQTFNWLDSPATVSAVTPGMLALLICATTWSSVVKLNSTYLSLIIIVTPQIMPEHHQQ